jgi:hypothetical protein
MGVYFSPWRRKVGVVTLLMACVAMSAWVRSQITQDTLTIGFGSSIQRTLVSISGRLIMVHVSIDAKLPIRTIPWTSQKAGDREWELRFELPDRSRAIWQHAVSEDLFSTGTDEMGANFTSFAVKWCQIPYWFIISPLTLVTCWLLISKPRPSKSKAVVEPIPETVA